MLEAKAIFSGEVQGVGFRYAASRQAQILGIPGYVRNLPNGNVELVAQGEKNTLNDFLENLKTEFHCQLVTAWLKPNNIYQKFNIEF